MLRTRGKLGRGLRVPLKIIGLLGGLSWESSAQYYRRINEETRRRLGGLHSARCLMWSFDFADVEALQRAGQWADATSMLIDAARALERGGADCIVICSNTMHRMADEVQAAIGVPLLHNADATGQRIRAAGQRRVGLLGTAFTMEQPFYARWLMERHGVAVMIPDAEDRAVVHRIIYDELVQGRVKHDSRQAYRDIMARLVVRGAEAIILGCTEIMLLVGPADCAVPLFDTTSIHADAAVDFALGGC